MNLKLQYALLNKFFKIFHNKAKIKINAVIIIQIALSLIQSLFYKFRLKVKIYLKEIIFLNRNVVK